MVHPYIRRRRGREPVTYPHPSLEPILRRTLGVPLFQEQLLRMAMVTAGFTGTEAEELRRAFGFKRSEARMAEVEAKLRAGMARQGIHGEAADQIAHAITAFALYGFPESHASSFALLAYASAYLKVHHPAAFYAALLNNQPMGFYHAATIVKDAQRRGQRLLPVDVTRSRWPCTIEGGAVRLGLNQVKRLRERAGQAIVAARTARAFTSVDDVARRANLERAELTTLAAIDAFAALGGTRRANLWMTARPLPGEVFAEAPAAGQESPLRDMDADERLTADYQGTALTLGPHPMALRRRELARHPGRPILRAADLRLGRDGQRVRVAGNVIVRQRPGTATRPESPTSSSRRACLPATASSW
jgi:error-prone DNA polymerase